MVKQLLWEELRITATGQYVDSFNSIWRGSRRSVEVIFGNVRDDRDLGDEQFHPLDPSAWRLVVDYPFDEGTHGPADDRNRVEKLTTRFHDRVVCWIPAALTAARQADLGRLVILDAVLSGQRFATHAKHLNEADRVRAHATLTSQRDALMVTLRAVLRQAYGVATKKSEDVVPTYDEHLLSLSPGPPLTLPVGARMADALHSVADQVLRRQYPAHPDFDPDRSGKPLSTADIRTVMECFRRAVESPDGRVEVERKDRQALRRIANPLLLGEMHEAAFVLGRHWVEHFHRRAGQEGIDGDLRARDLLRWIDEPQAYGLDPVVAQLVLAAFAEQTDRTWIRHGSIMTPQPELTAITPDLALRTPQRPDDDDWVAARERTMHLFGFMPPGLPRGRLVAMFVQDLSGRARQYRDAAHRLVAELERHAGRLGLDPHARSGRLHTARVAADLLDGLESRRNDIEIVKHLANADLGGPPQRTGRSIRSADDVVRAMRDAPWDTFDLIAGLGESWSAEAETIFAMLRQAAADDEQVTQLAPALLKARTAATDLLRRATRRPPPPRPPSQHGETRRGEFKELVGIETVGSEDEATAQAHSAVAAAEDIESALEQVREAARRNPGRRIEITWRVRP